MKIPHTDIDVFPLCLGGNVFGWTADEPQSFAVLDAYAEAGGNFVDTADSYSAWVPGHAGGESETVIGRWMAARGTRGRMIVATKVGRLQGREGLSPANIRAQAEDSLRRLGVERIDLYYAHADDPKTPLEETLGAFDALVRGGKVRAIAASNYTAPRLAEALAVSKQNGFARYVALQPHYNLVHRVEYETGLRPLCEREQLACFPYFALAKGFLTGKYRPGATVDSPRSAGASAYLDETGLAVLQVLDELSKAHGTTAAAVALAWLKAQPTVVAPIASARTPAQLAELLPMATLTLSAEELERLAAASAARV
jgi:aryl-alcohol dehydrogenase-like predicted oxidoreductase